MINLLGNLLKRNAKKQPSLQEVAYARGWVNACIAFRNQIYNPKSALYTSCGYDASPARAFDNITFVDLENGNTGCIDALKRAGFNALKSDIREYKPKELHDLLILMNPAIETEWASQHLKTNGFILSNDYHGNASWMAQHPEQFSLVAHLNEGESIVVSRNLEGMFQPVKTMAELKEQSPERYATTMKLIKHLLTMGREAKLSESDDENYFSYCDLMGMERQLPARRKAELYVFQKLGEK